MLIRFFLRLAVVLGITLQLTSAFGQEATGQNVGQLGDGIGASFALGQGDIPSVSYFNENDKVLRFGQLNGQSFFVSVVDSSLTETSATALAFTNGYPNILYISSADAKLRHARVVNGAWSISAVPGSDNAGEGVSATNCGSSICVSFYDAINRDLKLGRWNGVSWSVQLVDGSSDDVGAQSSVAAFSDGRVAIAYFDRTNRRLKVAVESGGGFTIESISFPGELIGQNPSAVISTDNTLHISVSQVKGTNPPHELGLYYLRKRAAGQWDMAKAVADYSGGVTTVALHPDGTPEIAARYIRVNPYIGNKSNVFTGKLELSGLWNINDYSGEHGANGGYYSYDRLGLMISSAGEKVIGYRFHQAPFAGNQEKRGLRIHQPASWSLRTGPLPVPMPNASPTPTPTPTPSPTPTPDPRLAPELDSDGDGVSDNQELLDGTDPQDPASVLPELGNNVCAVLPKPAKRETVVAEAINTSPQAVEVRILVRSSDGKLRQNSQCTAEANSLCKVDITAIARKLQSGLVCAQHSSASGAVDLKVISSRAMTRNSNSSSIQVSQSLPGSLADQAVPVVTRSGKKELLASVQLVNLDQSPIQGIISSFDARGRRLYRASIKLPAQSLRNLPLSKLRVNKVGSLLWESQGRAGKAALIVSYQLRGALAEENASSSATVATRSEITIPVDQRGVRTSLDLLGTTASTNVSIEAFDNNGNAIASRQLNLRGRQLATIDTTSLIGINNVGLLKVRGSSRLIVSSRRISIRATDGSTDLEVNPGLLPLGSVFKGSYSNSTDIQSKLVLVNSSAQTNNVTVATGAGALIEQLNLAPFSTTQLDLSKVEGLAEQGLITVQSDQANTILPIIEQRAEKNRAISVLRQ